MKRYLIPLVLACLCSTGCSRGETVPSTAMESVVPNQSAETEVSVKQDETDDVTVGEPALWTLTDEDTTVYLFGTVHVLKPEIEWRSDTFDEAFDSSEIVYFETPITGNEQESVKLVTELGLNPPGVRLRDLLTAEDAVKVERAAKRVGMPVAGIDTMRPWFASIIIGLAMLSEQGHDPESGVESKLEPEARAAGKQLRYFESTEQQLRFFADLSDETQIDFLIQGIDQLEDAPDMIDQMDDAWLLADLDELKELVIDPMKTDAPEVYDALIRQRNVRWVSAIEGLMTEPTTAFIAVGAGHLVGEDSVVLMLRDRGWSIEGP